MFVLRGIVYSFHKCGKIESSATSKVEAIVVIGEWVLWGWLVKLAGFYREDDDRNNIIHWRKGFFVP